MCSKGANVGPARRSSVGILHRMPKPGSFASRSCTLSEHLRARPSVTPKATEVSRWMRRRLISGPAGRPRQLPTANLSPVGSVKILKGRRLDVQ